MCQAYDKCFTANCVSFPKTVELEEGRLNENELTTGELVHFESKMERIGLTCFRHKQNKQIIWLWSK